MQARAAEFVKAEGVATISEEDLAAVCQQVDFFCGTHPVTAGDDRDGSAVTCTDDMAKAVAAGCGSHRIRSSFS